MTTFTNIGLEEYAVPGGAAALHARIAANMADAVYAGDPTGPAWLVQEARDGITQAVDGKVIGPADVSVSALQLLLGYVLHLEQVVATMTPRGGA